MTDAELAAERLALARESTELKAEQRKTKRDLTSQRELSAKLHDHFVRLTAFTNALRARNRRRDGGDKA
jgi:hypothetical protein